MEEIFLYWAERAGRKVADRIIDAIIERFGLLRQYPMAGTAADWIAPEARCLPVGKYLIYYRNAPGAMDILHVFHGARNQRRAFKKAKPRAKSSGPTRSR